MGYEVTIADPRRAFLASARFSASATTVAAWPDKVIEDLHPGPRDAVLVFTHDAKLDVPALMAAFATEAGYIGALGSRQTSADREVRLREAGATDADLERLYAPAGPGHRGGHRRGDRRRRAGRDHRTPGGRPGGSLRETSGPIRRERSDSASLAAPVD
jgi:xanthine dehydrogenase accessory factor